MSAQSGSDLLASRVRWIPPAAGVSAVLVGGLVLTGWWLDLAVLKRLWIGVHTTKANTALAFILTGVALWLSQEQFTSGWSRRAARICASIIVLLSLLTLSEYLLGWDLGIDQLLVADLQAPGGQHHIPGRMAPATALDFLLLGGAFLLLDVQTSRGYQVAPFLAIAVAGSAALTIVAYLYGGTALHYVYPLVTLDAPAAALFLALAIGVLFARAQHAVVSVMTSETVAGAAMRRLLVIAIVLPIFAGWVRLKGQQSGFFGTEFGLALIVTFAIIALTASVYWQANSLIRAEEFQRGINEMAGMLTRSLQLEEIYPAYAEAFKAILPYHRISVVVRQGKTLVAALSVAERPLESFQGKAWPALGETAVDWVMTHKIPRLVRDLSQDQRFPDEAFAAREGVRATLLFPLMAGGEAVGVFVVDSRNPGAYSERHEELVGLVTEQLALAIQNARLYAQVRRHAEELERQVEERTQELTVANGRLAEASRHKSAFLANMTHELRTPLNSILGFADLLRDQTGGLPTAKPARYLDHIRTSGRHLLALINDLLDLSKVEAGKLTLHPEPIVISETLTAILRELQPMADGKGLTLTLEADTAPPTLIADPLRLRQILYNLLSNAVKFSLEDGQVTVTARRDPHRDNFVDLSIADTGIGIAAEEVSNLFQPFTQLELTATTHAQGTGLGLALTKHLVELHGGTIAVASAGKGHGSTFTVRLPLAPPASPERDAR